MTQLLQDVFIVENLQVLTEGKGNDTMKIKGVFGRCNEKNNNGRIYPTNVLEGQLQKVQPLISERRLCGELDHPQNDTVKLSNASHLITKLEMKGNELIGEAEILKTPAGLTAKALVEGGVKIGISSRGMGTLSEDAKGNKIVNEDFRLVTFDLVADPSTRGAFPGLSESTQSQFARESQSKLEKESNFVTLLQSKLREAYDPWIEEAKTKKKKGGFPDLNKDGEITKADVLVGRGVIPGPKGKKKKMMEAVKAEGSWHQIAYTLADGLGLVDLDEAENAVQYTKGIQRTFQDAARMDAQKKKGIDTSEYENRPFKSGKRERSRSSTDLPLKKKRVSEGFADELEKARQGSSARMSQAAAQGGAAGGKGLLGRYADDLRARTQAKKMEIAKAKGVRAGSREIARGDVEAARIRQRALDGKPVTGMDYTKIAAGATGKAMAAPFTATYKGIRNALAARKAAKAKEAENKPEPPKKPETPTPTNQPETPKKPDAPFGAGVNDQPEPKPKAPKKDVKRVDPTKVDPVVTKRQRELQRKNLATQADARKKSKLAQNFKKATDAIKARKAAAAEKEASSFGAGVQGRPGDRNVKTRGRNYTPPRRGGGFFSRLFSGDYRTMQAPLKKGKRYGEWVAYRQLGMHLAEAFELIESTGERRPLEDRKRDSNTPESAIMRATKQMTRAEDAPVVRAIKSAVKAKDARDKEREKAADKRATKGQKS